MFNATSLKCLLPGVKLGILPQAQHVCEDSVGPRHTEGKLAIEGICVVDVNAVPVAGVEKSPLLRILLGVVGLEQRLVPLVPGVHEFGTAFLDPSLKIL